MTIDELFTYFAEEKDRAKVELGTASEFGRGFQSAMDAVLHKLSPDRWSDEISMAAQERKQNTG